MGATIKELPPGSFEGQRARGFEIVSDQGYRAIFNAIGARLMALEFPDGFDAVAGPERIEDIAGSDVYAGAICGRFANRIAAAQFLLEGEIVHVSANEAPHHLHGGVNGFHRKAWQADIADDQIVFTLISPDNEEGYPGQLRARAAYRFDGATLSCHIEARTTKSTIVNLTNHVYWNLSGAEKILDHRLKLSASRHTPTDAALIPSGEAEPVAGTAHDFRVARLLADAFAQRPQGFDENFCLDGARGILHQAASLSAAERHVDLYTTEPGVQVYTAAHHGPSFKGKTGLPLRRFGSIALEPQAWPDAPNHARFPSAALGPGETYRHLIEWRFSTG